MRRLAVKGQVNGLRTGLVLACAAAIGTGALVQPAAGAEHRPAQAGTWTRVDSLNTGRDMFAAALGGDGRIYAIGGLDRNGMVLRSVEAYDPARDHWTTVAPM